MGLNIFCRGASLSLASVHQDNLLYRPQHTLGALSYQPGRSTRRRQPVIPAAAPQCAQISVIPASTRSVRRAGIFSNQAWSYTKAQYYGL